LTWKTFWNPQGRGYLLFFSKFFVFALLGFFVWIGFRYPYNFVLNHISSVIVEHSLPVIDHRFNPDEGSMEVMCEPYRDGPIKPQKNKPVVPRVWFNVVNYNLIPFFAFMFASPVEKWRKLFIFLLIGVIILGCTHVFHIYIGFKYNYFKIQFDRDYFTIKNHEITKQEYNEYQHWRWKNQLLIPTLFQKTWQEMQLQPLHISSSRKYRHNDR